MEMPPSLFMGDKSGGGHRYRGDRSQFPKDRGTKIGWPRETGAEDGGQGAGQDSGWTGQQRTAQSLIGVGGVPVSGQGLGP